MNKQGQTIKEWLEQLASTNTSTEQDSARMQNLLRRVGFPQAVALLGVVYTEGRGTVDFPPMSIHYMAKVLWLKARPNHE